MLLRKFSNKGCERPAKIEMQKNAIERKRLLGVFPALKKQMSVRGISIIGELF